MKESTEEPICLTRDRPHSWAKLGKEDNGEEVSRCGNCLVHKYEGKDGTRYEDPRT